MPRRIQIDPGVYFFTALLVLTIPLDWLLAAVCAAAFHELCHIMVIMALGGTVASIHIRIGGAVLETGIPGKWGEILSAAAGPLGSFFLLFFCHIFPKLSIAACVQGMFNLIPIYPLDGGRIWKGILDMVYPSGSDTIQRWTEILFCFLAAVFAVAANSVLSMGYGPAIAAAFLIIRVILRKRPCKPIQIGVQ